MPNQNFQNDPDLIDLLRLYSISGIGSARMRSLLSAFGKPGDVLRAPVQHLIRVTGITRTTAEKIKTRIDDEYLQRQIDYLISNQIDVIPAWYDSYPELLKKIYDPPVVLFVRGKLPAQNQKAIAVVGTRSPSEYGKNITIRLTTDLARAGITIISGLARGVDTVAHRTALQNGACTVAVLGSGHDMLYPRENTNLADQIVASGAVISEFPPGTIPDPGNFPRRNRIVSGLSLGVLVTEAGLKSGAIITAFEALEQNREVFAVPGPISSPKSAGTNRLIKEGAKLVQDIGDIVNELGSSLNMEMVSAGPQPDLAVDEKHIYDLLSDDPVHIDQLTRRAERMTSEVLSVLLTLELMGLVRQLSGKMFVRI